MNQNIHNFSEKIVDIAAGVIDTAIGIKDSIINPLPYDISDREIEEVIKSSIFEYFNIDAYTNPDDLVGKFGVEIYQKMLHDSEIKASLRELFTGVLSSPLEIEPTDRKNKIAMEQADFVAWNLDNLGGVLNNKLTVQPKQAFLYDFMLQALSMGNGVWEKVLVHKDYKGYKDRICYANLKGKPQADYEFRPDSYGNLISVDFTVNADEFSVNPQKLIIFPWLSTYFNWYGESEFRQIYDCYWLSKVVLKMAGQFIEKRASGVWMGTYKRKDLRQKAMLERVIKVASSTGALIMPEGMKVDVERATVIEGNIFINFAELLNRKVRRALVGLVTTAEPAKAGDAAGQDSRDSSVKQPFLNLIAENVVSILERQFSEPIINVNWSSGQRFYPKILFRPRKKIDVSANSKVLAIGYNMNLPIPAAEYTRLTGVRTAIDEGEDFVQLQQMAAFQDQLMQGAGGRGETVAAQLPDFVGTGTPIATLSEGQINPETGELVSIPRQPKQDPKIKPPTRKPWKLSIGSVYRLNDDLVSQYSALVSSIIRSSRDRLIKSIHINFDRWRTESRNEINGLQIPYISRIKTMFKQTAIESESVSISVTKQQLLMANVHYKSLGFSEESLNVLIEQISSDLISTISEYWFNSFHSALKEGIQILLYNGFDDNYPKDKIINNIIDFFVPFGGSNDKESWTFLNMGLRNVNSIIFNSIRFKVFRESDIIIGGEYIGNDSAGICNFLSYMKFSESDPELDLFWPPNHTDCNSIMEFIFAFESYNIRWDSFPIETNLQPQEGFGRLVI